MAGKQPSQGLAIAALLLNILILPGLGSLIGGRIKTGVIQLVLFIGGALVLNIGKIPLSFSLLIGIPLIIGIWIWALLTGIQIIKGSKSPQTFSNVSS